MAQEIHLSRVQQEILESLAETGLRYTTDDIAHQCDRPVGEIEPALGELVEKGFVNTNGGDDPRYRITGDGRIALV